MLQLDICLGWVFYFSRCVYTLIKLKLKNHLVRVRKTSRFGLKYPFGRHDRMIREMVGWSDGNGNVCSAVRCLAVMLAVIRPHHLHFLRWKLVNKRLRLYHVWWTANIMSWCLGWLNTMVSLLERVQSAVMPLSHVQEEPWLPAVVNLLSRTRFELSWNLIHDRTPCSQSETSIFCSHSEFSQFITSEELAGFLLFPRPFLSEQACFSQ